MARQDRSHRDLSLRPLHAWIGYRSHVAFDPTSLDLDALFPDPAMFESRRTWRRAGFEVLDPAKDTECMVAAHPTAPGYLFKRYTTAISRREQRANYEARIEGAARVTALVQRYELQHVVVPRKHLHALRSDSKSCVLVVERLDIVGRDESENRYYDIADEVLRDLLRVIDALPGLDSNSKNVQFTRDGKIAFIDLENWNRADRKQVQLKSISRYLSKTKYKRAREILDEL